MDPSVLVFRCRLHGMKRPAEYPRGSFSVEIEKSDVNVEIQQYFRLVSADYIENEFKKTFQRISY